MLARLWDAAVSPPSLPSGLPGWTYVAAGVGVAAASNAAKIIEAVRRVRGRKPSLVAAGPKTGTSTGEIEWLKGQVKWLTEQVEASWAANDALQARFDALAQQNADLRSDNAGLDSRNRQLAAERRRKHPS